MNKADLINAMAEKAGLSKADSKKALDGFISAVTKAYLKVIKLFSWFGSFSVAKEQLVQVSICN
jgi:DNA-binding protein HU-beta